MAQSYSQLANPPNLMNLYIQAQQRDQAMQGFNQRPGADRRQPLPALDAQSHHAERERWRWRRDRNGRQPDEPVRTPRTRWRRSSSSWASRQHRPEARPAAGDRQGGDPRRSRPRSHQVAGADDRGEKLPVGARHLREEPSRRVAGGDRRGGAEHPLGGRRRRRCWRRNCVDEHRPLALAGGSRQPGQAASRLHDRSDEVEDL